MCWGANTPAPGASDAGTLPPGGVAPCPYQCPNVEIEINDSAGVDDDWVMLCAHTPRHTLPCRIRASGSASQNVDVVLLNPDGRLRFGGEHDSSITLTIPADGAWVAFPLSGAVASGAVDDALIEAHCHCDTGPVVGSKTVTVVAMERVGLFEPSDADEDGADDPVLELPEVNALSLLPIADHVAHRVLQLRCTPIALTQGKVLQWALTVSGIQTGAVTANVLRGALPTAAHSTRLEADGASAFTAADQRSTLAADGIAAVRINLPPVAFNKGRLSASLLQRAGCASEWEFEVPGIVVIDPGHGGVGSVGGSDGNHATSPSGVLEKTMTLDYARLVRDALDAAAQTLRVFMTRDADVNLSLEARANVGRDRNADAFVSIHMNGFNGVAHGTTIFVRTLGSDQFNHDEDVALATRIVDAVVAVNPASDRAQRLNDMGLGVLRDSDLGNDASHHKTRACLLEVDFIDVPSVDEALNTGANAAANRQAICNAIAGAIIDDLLNQPP